MSSKLTIDEMAAELRICTRTFRRLIKKRNIPHYRVGRALRFDRSEVEACFRVAGDERSADHARPTPRPTRPHRGRFADRLGLD
ncbi:MAG: helix-turn-helix domain-containing protein [Acidobacteria bacterium]|nr:helix-turn-helix domain-containing protein [Acidobacteriota bacterium]